MGPNAPNQTKNNDEDTSANNIELDNNEGAKNNMPPSTTSRN
jgi:hypothetical protein